jgi:hypothetical protein
VSSTDFIDQLERELRAASQRRVRLELARVPRVPAGATVLAFSVALILAVAVPLLATGSRSSMRSAGGRTPGAPVTRSCGDTVSGQLPGGWQSQRAGTVTTGPISWLYLEREKASPRSVAVKHFVEAMAVVAPGREVTVTVPAGERHDVSLDYTDVSPRSRFQLSDGASSVTFSPCSGPLGRTQFDGGFILSRARCVTVIVDAGSSGTPTPYSIPVGRSCGPFFVHDNDLKGNGIGRARFGDRAKSVIDKLDRVLGHRPTRKRFGAGQCNINGEVDWPGLAAYFHDRRFVGYSYGPKISDGGLSTFATTRGLRVGETVRQARRIYGSAFKVSTAQGGSWSVRTPHGRIDGFLSDLTKPRSKVLTIEAGNVGCPALTP